MPTLHLELKRAFGNRWFLISGILMMVISLIAAIMTITAGLHEYQVFSLSHVGNQYTFLSCNSSYTQWVAIDHITSAVELFFLVAPLLVTMGYAWSLASDCTSGYIEQLAIRTTRARLYAARYLATFLTGGSLIAVPLAFNFVLCACFMPSYTPDVFDQMYIPMRTSELFGDVFYNAPMVYVILRILVDFILCGAWSVVVLALSTIIRNRVALITLPFIALLAIKHISQQIYIALRVNGFEGFGYSITLFDQLRGAPDAFYCPGWVTGLCLVLMLSISLALPLCSRKRDLL